VVDTLTAALAAAVQPVGPERGRSHMDETRPHRLLGHSR
jgi:hypothetical protein